MSKGLTPLKATEDDNDEIIGYRFAIDCPQCGGDLVHVTAGTSTGLRAGAIAHCTRCRMEYAIVVAIDHARPIPGKGRTRQPVGLTHTNYSRVGRRA